MKRIKKYTVSTNTEAKNNDDKLKKITSNERIDGIYGFDYKNSSVPCTGWLINMKASDMVDEENRIVSSMDYFFLQEDGSRFKATIKFQPYFYVATKNYCENEVCTYLKKKYGPIISLLEIIEKEDLDLDNHLSGLKRNYIRLSFLTLDDLNGVRRELLPQVLANKKREEDTSMYANLIASHLGESGVRAQNSCDNIVDIREHDVPYLVRASIDLALFVGCWYEISGTRWQTIITARPDLVQRPDVVVLAYDIETTKLPLKFPDSSFDQVMMISYMVDGRGYLICNRELIAADIEDFEFTPRPEFPGPFVVFNESNEKETLSRFFSHIRELRPNVIVTYNGDSFDWPFVESRAAVYGLDMFIEIGFNCDGEYKCRCVLHMDCYQWVKRDSYLPVGSQGLKAVCKAKLRYDPVEVDPEQMCALARDEPRTLANYSVSDAVATYYLYEQYVHPFIIALCTIIPLSADDVLRKGSGTLCESLLMVEATRANIIYPNKQQHNYEEWTNDGHLLESQTYVGGHVEAIESGVFRADIVTKFRVVPDMCQSLRDSLRATLCHALTVEEHIDLNTVVNLEQIINDVDTQLCGLQHTPTRMECPAIYHLDVAAMYPNIILSNRLQPSALVNETTCAACDHNAPAAKCKRPMTWMWRGEVMPATKSEYFLIQARLESDTFPPANSDNTSFGKANKPRAFHELSREEQATAERDRLGKFCRTAYKKTHITRLEERTSVVCQKENSFYVDTVRSFRDRRYEFKDLTKTWKRTLDGLVASGGDPGDIKRASGMLVLYDSLQLAHKCILNSFYGYVMRRGARWYSMEMAGIVCSTGAAIIKNAREIIEQIGRPLELDTDGIWCILPSSFPQNVTFTTTNPKRPTVTVSYPGAMLNLMVQTLFTNHQYHDLIDEHTHRYSVRSENSIFFEVDGPYKAMILPAAKEQGKKLKKRYAVFNFDNSLAELKGFEVKRNGELNLIKIFQSSVFDAFLKGTKIEEVYAAVASVADRWLDLLHSHGVNTSDEELLELISEKRCMSKKLTEYGKQKSTCISTARRLAEFLGDEMVKDAGLSFRFIISKKPEGLTVTERAIPIAIFQAEDSVRRHYLRKWLKIPDLEDIDLRDILDWHYYLERFSSNVQKIITIPAALQHVANPVPRVLHPDWLHKKLMETEDTFKQRKISDMFAVVPKMTDIEEMGQSRRVVAAPTKRPLEKVEDLCNHWKEKLTEETPSRCDSKLWLAYHKKKWIIQAEIKSRGQIKRTRTTTGKGIASFLSRTKRSILDDTWQIVQLIETVTPGIYKLWVLIGHDLHCLRLSVPRTFYVNTRVPKEDDENAYFKRVQKQLPRSHTVYHLYEYSIDESIYIEHSADVKTEFVRNEVEGVYELGVPLLFRALMSLGCLCSVVKTRDRAHKHADTMFQLSDLQLRTVAQHPYLEHNALKTVLIYHRKSGINQIIAVFFPAQNKAHLLLIEPTRLGNYGHYTKTVSAEYHNTRANGGTLICPEEMTFEVSAAPDRNSGFKTVNKLVLAYKAETRVPTMVVVMSNVAEQITNHLPALNEFPVVTAIQPDTADNVFDVVFNWQELALQCALAGFVGCESVIESHLNRARYLHVPIGNLSVFVDDWSSCDLFFARYLTKNGHVLWCTAAADPDLGGKETLDRRQMLLDSDMPVIQHQKPGSYPTVCVELDMTFVIIQTIVAMEKIQEIDGTNSRLFDTTTAASKGIDDLFPNQDPRKRNFNLNSNVCSYDDTVAAAPAFRILRKVFLDWINDVKDYQNPIADEHIINFYKWLRTPTSLLYDPALYKTVQKLMRKLFFKLIEQMSNLGVDVVHANLNKIILCTKKTDLHEALLHVEYATTTIRNQEIFSVIEFQYCASWDYLLWQDDYNYSGIKSDLNALMNESPLGDLSFVNLSEPMEVFSAELRDPARLDLRWHLVRYLSPDPVIQVRFVEILFEFMFTICGILKEEFTIARLAREMPSQSQQLGSLITGHDASVYPTSINKIEKYLLEEVPNKLYSAIMNIKESPKFLKKVILNENQELSPLLPLKCNYSLHPILDYIKTLSHVLSLDSFASKYTNDWKTNMLRVLGVDSFSVNSFFRSPYSRNVEARREVACKGELLITVTGLICDQCSMVRDLDICRDINCQSVNETWSFICPRCSGAYDKDVLQTALVDQLDSLTELFLLQDLSCTNCTTGIIDTSLAGTKNCRHCGHSLRCTRSALLLEQQIAVFADVGKYFGMEYLASRANWMFA